MFRLAYHRAVAAGPWAVPQGVRGGRWRLRFPLKGLLVPSSPEADVAELADALDSKSSDRKVVWVRSPPSAEALK